MSQGRVQTASEWYVLRMMNNGTLVLVFVPSLAALLLRAEEKKGSRLTREEVEALRDGATVVAVPPAVARAMEEERGYRDAQADRCWDDWLVLRKDTAEAP
jgi:hypothetical protein